MLQASWGRRGNHQQEQDSPNLGTAFQRFPVIPTCPIWKACSEKNTLVHNLTVACTLHKSLLITVKSDTPRDKTISPFVSLPFLFLPRQSPVRFFSRRALSRQATIIQRRRKKIKEFPYYRVKKFILRFGESASISRNLLASIQSHLSIRAIFRMPFRGHFQALFTPCYLKLRHVFFSRIQFRAFFGPFFNAIELTPRILDQRGIRPQEWRLLCEQPVPSFLCYILSGHPVVNLDLDITSDTSNLRMNILQPLKIMQVS